MVLNPRLPRPTGRTGELGGEAYSAGQADQNESVSARERSGESLSEIGTGPKIGKNGEHLPAKYKQTTVFMTPAGPVSIEQIVEDR